MFIWVYLVDMDIKPIRTKTDYKAALQQAEHLLDMQPLPQPGTPEGDHMDVLLTLIDAYEAQHDPVPLPDDPVAVLEYYIESRGLHWRVIDYTNHAQ
jgi:HTH-type transcriptional regulator/antitoxin HigA